MAARKRGGLGKHLGDRVADAIDGTINFGQGVSAAVSTAGRALFSDPRKTAPDLLALACGFFAGSGGLDGDGGVPDLDLALGIEWHRSILTHSIIAGTLVEGAILAVVDLADVVCEQLPAGERDPFWDELVATKDRIAKQLSAGVSAGIAYHLAVDATLQEAPYKDLPFEASTEVHQGLMAANAVAEGIDAFKKEPSVGRKVVDGAADGARAVMAYGAGFLAGLRRERK